jgi:hypothetical protein
MLQQSARFNAPQVQGPYLGKPHAMTGVLHEELVDGQRKVHLALTADFKIPLYPVLDGFIAERIISREGSLLELAIFALILPSVWLDIGLQGWRCFTEEDRNWFRPSSENLRPLGVVGQLSIRALGPDIYKYNPLCQRRLQAVSECLGARGGTYQDPYLWQATARPDFFEYRPDASDRGMPFCTWDKHHARGTKTVSVFYHYWERNIEMFSSYANLGQSARKTSPTLANIGRLVPVRQLSPPLATASSERLLILANTLVDMLCATVTVDPQLGGIPRPSTLGGQVGP